MLLLREIAIQGQRHGAPKTEAHHFPLPGGILHTALDECSATPMAGVAYRKKLIGAVAAQYIMRLVQQHGRFYLTNDPQYR